MTRCIVFAGFEQKYSLKSVDQGGERKSEARSRSYTSYKFIQLSVIGARWWRSPVGDCDVMTRDNDEKLDAAQLVSPHLSSRTAPHIFTCNFVQKNTSLKFTMATMMDVLNFELILKLKIPL